METKSVKSKDMASGMLGNILLFRCVSCQESFYSLDHDFGKISNATAMQKHIIQCLPCPYGGECSNRIKSKPNFWGYQSDDLTIKLLLFPSGYCCHGQNCVSYNSCNESKEGRLCRKGYVQGLMSATCIKEKK